MLTVRASSSHRSDLVQKRNARAAIATATVAATITTVADRPNGGPSRSSRPEPTPASTATAPPPAGAPVAEAGPDPRSPSGPVPWSGSGATGVSSGSTTEADEGGAASMDTHGTQRSTPGGTFCQFLGPFGDLAVTCPHDRLRLWQSASVWGAGICQAITRIVQGEREGGGL